MYIVCARLPLVWSSHVSQNVTLYNMVIVLTVCSLTKWTATRAGSCISVGRFVRVIVWSTSISDSIYFVMWEVTGEFTWIQTRPVTSQQNFRVIKLMKWYIFLLGKLLYVASVIMARKVIFLSCTAEAWNTTALLPHLATRMPVCGL